MPQIMAVFHISLLAICALCLNSVVSQNSDCAYVYGDWSPCIDEYQNRTIGCMCEGVVVNIIECYMRLSPPHPNERDCDVVDDVPLVCFWKWSKWSDCTVDCDGGITNRTPYCICNGLSDPVSAEKCDYLLLNETVPCNEFKCGDVPALNKLYWMSKDDEYLNNKQEDSTLSKSDFWPVVDGIFNCSNGVDLADGNDTPKGKSYTEILQDPNPAIHLHPEWYLLAKEWIASKLNQANGVHFSPEAIGVINDIGLLLETCSSWNSGQTMQAYAGKEKLSRINNNIGGLSDVDKQLELLFHKNSASEGGNNALLVMAIIIPIIVVLVIGFALAFTVRYIREKRNAVVVEHAEFESEDEEEPLQTNTPDIKTVNQVELEYDKHPTDTGDTTSEEQQ